MGKPKVNINDYMFTLENPLCRITDKNPNDPGGSLYAVLRLPRHVRSLKGKKIHVKVYNPRAYYIKREHISVHLALSDHYDGLVRIDNKGRVVEKNIFKSFVNIKNKRELIDFLSRNGFLYNMNDRAVATVSYVSIFSIIKRLQVAVKLKKLTQDYLMNPEQSIDNQTTEKILSLTLNLLLVPSVKNEEKYSIKQSMFRYYFKEYYLFADKLDTIFDEIRSFSKTPAQNGLYYIKDTIKGIHIMPQCMYDSIRLSRFYYQLDESNRNSTNTKDICLMYYYKIAYLYLFGVDFNDSTKEIIDFLFHFFDENYPDLDITSILNYSPNGNNFPHIKHTPLNHVMREKLKNIAKLTLANEADSYLQKINPRYNTDKLACDWNLNSLENALYFCFCFYKSNDTTILKRPCECCKKVFTPRRKNQIYCDERCASRERQRRYRESRRKEENTDTTTKSP